MIFFSILAPKTRSFIVKLGAKLSLFLLINFLKKSYTAVEIFVPITSTTIGHATFNVIRSAIIFEKLKQYLKLKKR